MKITNSRQSNFSIPAPSALQANTMAKQTMVDVKEALRYLSSSCGPELMAKCCNDTVKFLNHKHQLDLQRTIPIDLLLNPNVEISSVGSSLQLPPLSSVVDLNAEESCTLMSGDPERKHVCMFCGKGFFRPSQLQTHMNSHTGLKPHVCLKPGCGKRFSVLSNLKRHQKIHERSVYKR